MGGRGAAGSGSAGIGSSPKLQDLSGSERQIKWASEIRQTALKQLDAMEQNYKRLEKTAKAEKASGSNRTIAEITEDLAGYGLKDIQAGREALVKFMNDPRAKSASVIIDRRRSFDPNAIRRMVHDHARQRKMR